MSAAPVNLEIKQRITHIEIESMKAPIVNGVKMCLNGCGTSVPDSNSKYCSLKCSTEFWAKHSQAGIRKYLWEREQGTCQGCGYKVPVFRARPVQPVFGKTRPEETSFPHYHQTSIDRIAHFQNVLVTADVETKCSCGKTIVIGEDCYCQFPNASDCHMFCAKMDDKAHSRWERVYMREKTVQCKPNFYCVDCGLKEIAAIEKQWKSDHRKALAAFKKAYRQWDKEYTAWVSSGVMREYREAEKQYEAEYALWQTTADFRSWVADHIIPIALGGAEFDPNNWQLLCSICDKKKTAQDAANIARTRRHIKNVGKNATTLTNYGER